jgi:hypothetical protein
MVIQSNNGRARRLRKQKIAKGIFEQKIAKVTKVFPLRYAGI